MKIHDILLRATRDHIGQTLSSSDIQSLAIAQDPKLKPGSVLPSEHARAMSKRCKRCQQQPLFAPAGHGLYKVLPVQDEQIEINSHDLILLSLLDAVGSELNVVEIKAKVCQFYPRRSLSGIIPANHAEDSSTCKNCLDAPLLRRVSRGVYRVLDGNPKPANSASKIDQLKPVAENKQAKADELRKTIRRFGRTQLARQPESFLPLLEKLYPSQERDGHVLQLALKDRIGSELLDFGDLLPWPVLEQRLADRLFQNYAMSPDIAHWAVQTWGLALEIPAALAQDFSQFAGARKAARQLKDESETYLTPERLRSSECRLKHLTLKHADSGYDALKRQQHNVAMVSFDPEAEKYVLGIRSALSESVVALLKNYARPECPPEFRQAFSPQRRQDWKHQNYTWFVGLPRSLVVQAFQVLDTHFPD